MMSKTFALVGAAGYIAPTHMEAIKSVGGNLIAIHDPHDSVGVIDKYFQECKYFREMDSFMRFLRDKDLDYFVICSPNYLHEYHCQLGLTVAKEVICEKPLGLKPENICMSPRVNAIVQLRLDPSLQLLKHKLSTATSPVTAGVTYYTPRGEWYDYSWKGNPDKSGGVIMNIGIHMLDMMCWLLGNWEEVIIYDYTPRSITLEVRFKGGKCEFLFSTNTLFSKERTLWIDQYVSGELKFDNLHTKAYEEIVAGNGVKPRDVYDGISLASEIRKAVGSKCDKIIRP